MRKGGDWENENCVKCKGGNSHEIAAAFVRELSCWRYEISSWKEFWHVVRGLKVIKKF